MNTDAHFNIINNRNLAQFYAACGTGNMATVEFALQKKFPINSTVKSSSAEYLGDTALHLAVKASDYFSREALNSIIEQLFSCGADVTISNAAKNSAIHIAFKVDSYNLVCALFAGHGYNRPNVTDQHGLSHFHIACYSNQTNFVGDFLKNRVAINSKCEQYSDNPNHYGRTALHFAVNPPPSLETVTLLMKYKADVNIKNQAGFNPLRSLYEFQADFKSNTVSAMLLSGDYHDDCVGDVQLFKLFHACQNEDVDKLGSVLEKHPNTIRQSISNDSPQWPGYTLLHFAATFGIVRVVKFLLLHASVDDVNAVNSKNLTPLHCVLKNNESNSLDTILQITNCLINCGADVEFEACNGFTPINYALTLAKQFKTKKCIQKFFEIINLPGFSQNEELNMLFNACLETDNNYIEKLENNGQLKKLVNMTTDSNVPHSLQGFTPLHFAVDGGNEKIVEILLKNGADFCAQSVKGLSPLHLAERATEDGIVDLILKFHSTKIKNPVDRDGLSHLHVACKHTMFESNIKLVQSFVESNIEINCIITKDILSRSEYDKLYTKGDTALHVIASRWADKEALVKLLLDHGADYTLRNADGATPQHLYFTGNTYILDYILSSNTKELVNMVDNDGWSYLYIACYKGKIDIVKTFLQKDQNALSKDNNVENETPLHAAVSTGRLQVVEMLISHGANIHAKNKNEGRTPLDCALTIRADYEHKNEIIRCLLSKLDVEETKPVNETELTLLHIAAIQNDTKTIERLLKLGLDVNSAINFNSPLWPGFTSLHLAIGFQCIDAIKLLIAEGADWTLKTKSGIFPFGFTDGEVARKFYMVASYRFMHESLNYIPWDVLSVIFKSKALPDIINIPVWSHCSIFHVLCCKGEPEDIKTMLKLDIDVNYPVDFFSDKYPGYTALHFAVESGCIESVRILVDHGANLNAEDAFGWAPVHLACKESSLEILKLLTLKGAYVNGRVMKMESNSCFNIFRNNLITPLHICALLEKWDFFVFLLNNGADIFLKNAIGETAYSIFYNVDDSMIQSLIRVHFQILTFFHFNTSDCDSHLFSPYNIPMMVDIKNECEKLLKDTTYVDNFTTLSDLIIANPQKMYRMKNQKNLQHILFSDEFNEKYPFCGFILKLQLQRGIEYKLSLWNTMYSINPFVEHLNSTYLPLPELCIEKILENLERDDFENLIEISNTIIFNQT